MKFNLIVHIQQLLTEFGMLLCEENIADNTISHYPYSRMIFILAFTPIGLQLGYFDYAVPYITRMHS